ncbi:MAG: sulfatase/phosphatase domain-containing protein, partial [Puniceicoccales bacterium]
EAAIQYLEQPHQKPFFLSVGLFYPHRKYKKADKSIFNPDYILPPAGLPDTPQTREDMADYHCSVADADSNIGRVLDTIRKTGRMEDSLILITTDHGLAFPTMKCNLTDSGIGVTLIMNYPENPSRGRSIDSLVSHIDIFPTICDLLNLDPPDHLEGTSIRPLFETEGASVRDEVYAEVNFHGAYEPMRCIRTNRYKLIKRFYRGKRRLSNCDGSISRETMIQQDWHEQELPERQLFDLFFDPHEANNLTGSPHYQDILNDLEERLTHWMAETNDPLLDGEMIPEPGARVCVPESIAAGEGPFIYY